MKSKKFLLCLSGFFIAAASFACSQELGDNLTIHELRPGLFVVVHAYPWPSNSLLAVMA